MVSSNRHEFRISKDLAALSLSAARDFARRAQATVHFKGVFNVVLSGGNTPKALFDVLADERVLGLSRPIPWEQIRFFWCDERFVPHSDAQSNWRMTQEHLLSKLSVPKQNVFSVPTEGLAPEQAAAEYEQVLRQAFGMSTPEIPVCDLVYLGMGPDGHTASLFPETQIVQAVVANSLPESQFVAAVWVEKFKMHRISLLPNIINAAGSVSMLVCGEDKAEALEKVVAGPYEPTHFPCQLIVPLNGQVWYLDEASASRLMAQNRSLVPDF